MPERIPAFDTGNAVVQRIDQGEGPDLNWEQCKAQTAHLTTLTKVELTEALAYLGAQLVGARKSVDADAVLAMHTISRAVAQYQKRHGS